MDRRNILGKDRITSRQIDELIGLARGIAADGIISQEEVECIQSWLVANEAVCNEPLFKDLYCRIEDTLSDGVLSQEEGRELLDLLRSLTGGNHAIGELFKSTTIPFSQPEPSLTFSGKRYCFTGTFTFGQRRACEQAVIQRGAEVGSITMKTNFLVVGTYATESWKHSSMGLKILKAAEYRSRGMPLAIVRETHWRQSL